MSYFIYFMSIFIYFVILSIFYLIIVIFILNIIIKLFIMEYYFPFITKIILIYFWCLFNNVFRLKYY